MINKEELIVQLETLCDRWNDIAGIMIEYANKAKDDTEHARLTDYGVAHEQCRNDLDLVISSTTGKPRRYFFGDTEDNAIE